MLTGDDKAEIYRIVTEVVNHAFNTHPRLARMEKRDAKMQRDINYLVEAVDLQGLRHRKDIKAIHLRLERLEGTA